VGRTLRIPWVLAGWNERHLPEVIGGMERWSSFVPGITCDLAKPFKESSRRILQIVGHDRGTIHGDAQPYAHTYRLDTSNRLAACGLSVCHQGLVIVGMALSAAGYNKGFGKED
jgi:hypothetical protein